MNRNIVLYFFICLTIAWAMPPIEGLQMTESDYEKWIKNGIDIFPDPIRDIGKNGIENTIGNVQVLISGVKKFPVVCIKYPNLNNQYAVENFQAMLYSDTWRTGSAKQYYQEVSYGLLTIQGSSYGWLTADSNRAYYGYSNGFARAARLAKEAAQKADSLINYALYDNNGDGYVDCFTCLHAGYGREESGNGQDIWSHSWSFTGANIGAYTTNDPDPNHPGEYIKINGYVCDPERSNSSNNGTMVCIGVFVHEWGHAMGCPDLYDTDGGGEGVGNWCVMGTGSWGGNNYSPWKPVHMCAWTKMRLGWLNPTAVRSFNLYFLPKVEMYPKAYWLISKERTFKEYFLVENRKKTMFDTLMWGEGYLIYHIDDSVIARRGGSLNAGGTGWKYGVAVEQADGYDHLYNGSNRGDGGDPFPGWYNKTIFDSISTNPNSKTNYPTGTELITSSLVKNIPQPASVMSANFSSGVTGVFTGGPDANNYRWIDSDTLTGPVYSWIDISSSGTALGRGDEARYLVNLPFSFNYYTNNYSTVWVSTNGWLCFGTDPGTNAPINQIIPHPAEPNQAVFVFWDDLNLVESDSANIYSEILGTMPNRYCVITWKDARIVNAPAANQVTFQAILYEGGYLVLQYKDCAVGDTVYNWGRNASVGIENNNGTVGLRYMYNGIPKGNLLASERAIQFYFANVNQLWVSRYNFSGYGQDCANSMAIDNQNNVYVTGWSLSPSSGFDYATIKYNASGTQQWVSRYNDIANGEDYANDIAVDTQGNIYVTGYSYGIQDDYATVKYNSSGIVEWVQRYNGLGNTEDRPSAVITDNQGNVYVTGYSISANADYTTIKYNSSGITQWIARYNGPSNGIDEAKAITTDNQGSVYVTGHSFGTDADIVTIKYNSNGVEQWLARYNGPANGYDEASAMTIDNQGNIYVTGWSMGVGTYFDYITIKYNQSGIQQWVQRYNGIVNDEDKATGIVVDNQENVCITGFSYNLDWGYDYVIVKYNANGEQVWVARYNGTASQNDFAKSIVMDNLGFIYVTGQSFGLNTNYDYTTIKYFSNGVPQWTQRYNGPANNNDVANSVLVDNAGNVYVTGASIGSATGNDFTTIKYTENSSFSNISEQFISAPSNVLVLSYNPNPFNIQTKINYILPVTGKVKISIFDASGRLVKNLINDEVSSGIHSIIWDGTNNISKSISQGIYFIYLKTEKLTEIKKIVKSK